MKNPQRVGEVLQDPSGAFDAATLTETEKFPRKGAELSFISENGTSLVSWSRIVLFPSERKSPISTKGLKNHTQWSKAKEKTNGTDQKGTAVAERASAGADSEQSVSAHQYTPAPGSRWDDPSPAERRFADELDRYLETFRLGSNLLANWPAAVRRGFGSGGTGMDPPEGGRSGRPRRGLSPRWTGSLIPRPFPGVRG